MIKEFIFDRSSTAVSFRGDDPVYYVDVVARSLHILLAIIVRLRLNQRH